MDLTQSLRPPFRLTTLPAEIRVQIYSYLFDSWTLHIDCARAAPVAAKEDDHTSGGHTASRHAGLNLRVHAANFPSSAFLTCRSLYADFKGLGPLPVGKLHVSCDLASAYVLRARFGELLDELRDRVDCLSARTLEVNQDGIYGLDIALVKGRMAGLKTIEVGMRDLAVNAQYAPGWVRKALEMEGTVVRNAEGDKGWESSEFAFGYLHSFLGWEMPTKERLEGNGIVRLLAKQEITIWAERKCLARMNVVHDIEKRRIVEAKKSAVQQDWQKHIPTARLRVQIQPIPFFGAWSCFDIPASAARFAPQAVR